jgi:cysteine desulfurase
MISGGHQEQGKRSGTYNVPAIMGMGEAARIININMQKNNVLEIEDYFWKKLQKTIPNIKRNAANCNHIPGVINVIFPEIESKLFVLEASKHQIYCSSGSACNEGDTKPSHVLTALGLNSFDAHCSVRFSLGDFSTKIEVDQFIELLPKIIKNIPIF